MEKLLIPLLPVKYKPKNCLQIIYEKCKIGKSRAEFWITGKSLSFDEHKLVEKLAKVTVDENDGKQKVEKLQQAVAQRDYNHTVKFLKENGNKMKVKVENHEFEIVLGDDVFESADQLYARDHHKK